MEDRRSESSSRLRIGGWLAPRHSAPDASPPPPPTTPSVSALAALPSADTGAADAADVPVGRHRASRRWQRLALAAAVATVAVIVAAQLAGGGTDSRGATSPVAEPGPIWTGDPDESWSLSTPPVSVEPSPSATSASPSATTRPASRKPTTPPVPRIEPSLSVGLSSVPSDVDLTEEGTRDWIHWGLTSSTSVDRRSGTAVITDLGGTSRGRYSNNPQTFSWSNGKPTDTVSGTPTGIYSCGEGSGFTLRVPASPTTRHLRLYAGVWMATGKLAVTLDGESETRALTNPSDITTARFDIDFRANAGTNLTLTWSATAVFNPNCGNVDMQAATLS
ncbi:hypothetical protein [Actinoplanes sp. NPDC051851]|uniref:hypothetical protein n=1 Tax=Actinoplanes sp. NPDC051851 TaxID=3154753 RepID=UPI003412F454